MRYVRGGASWSNIAGHASGPVVDYCVTISRLRGPTRHKIDSDHHLGCLQVALTELSDVVKIMEIWASFCK